jgi:PhnB protein
MRMNTIRCEKNGSRAHRENGSELASVNSILFHKNALFATVSAPLEGSSLIAERAKREDPMSKAVKPIPDGYHSVTPLLIIPGGKASQALDFYAHAFGAKEVMRMPRPDGGIAHAEIQLGDSRIMVADEDNRMDAFGPSHYGGSPVTLHIYLQDVDASTHQAADAGATVVRPLADQFYGDRTAGLEDPFGHRWYLATHVRNVSVDEMKQHMKTMAAA